MNSIDKPPITQRSHYENFLQNPEYKSEDVMQIKAFIDDLITFIGNREISEKLVNRLDVLQGVFDIDDSYSHNARIQIFKSVFGNELKQGQYGNFLMKFDTSEIDSSFTNLDSQDEKDELSGLLEEYMAEQEFISIEDVLVAFPVRLKISIFKEMRAIINRYDVEDPLFERFINGEHSIFFVLEAAAVLCDLLNEDELLTLDKALQSNLMYKNEFKKFTNTRTEELRIRYGLLEKAGLKGSDMDADFVEFLDLNKGRVSSRTVKVFLKSYKI